MPTKRSRKLAPYVEMKANQLKFAPKKIVLK